jgi:PAT family beta-lactamase induction signal transducer AmpG
VPADARPRAPFAWIAALAFASGFPFGLVNEALPVYLRTHGAGLVEVGLVQAATFPWTFKFLWAPLVDRYGTRGRWIIGCLLALGLLMGLLAAFDLERLASLFWFIVVAMVALSATQDVAIDAYTIESTPREQLGVANSVRIAAYRIAMFVAGGLLIWLAGRAGWAGSFAVGAGACLALALATLALPRVPRSSPPAEQIWEPLRALLRRDGIGVIVLFALLFKLDIAALDPMTRPFWVDRGFTLAEIGVVLTTGRMLATLAGAMLGGWVTTQWGMFRALWTLGLVQLLSSLAYAGAAWATPSKPLVIVVALFENFAAGLGTAAFVAFLMSVCERRYAATQYAVLSALLALTRSVAGALSGDLAERMGYAPYFLLTFVIGIPAFFLLPRLRRAHAPDDEPVPSSP